MKIGSTEWEDLIIKGAEAFGLDVNHKMTTQFGIHGNELIKWTKKINLTSITDPERVAVKHFLDSIAPARFVYPAAAVLDIGSGGGFPGIPLKILIPSISVLLIDGSRKKVNFLKHIIRKLNLADIDARQIRAEELAQDSNFTNVFDVIISRASSALGPFVKVALPLLADNGIIIALKGTVDQREINDVRSNVFKNLKNLKSDQNRYSLALEEYNLPFTQSKRSIITIRKVRL